MIKAILDIEVYPERVMVGILRLDKDEPIILDGIEQIRKGFSKNAFTNPNNLWITFNGMRYDLPIIEYILNGGNDPYEHSQKIISNLIDRPSWIKNHVDLYAIMPKIARCSLKEVGHRLGYPVLENLPYPYDDILTDTQWDHVISYNLHDLKITKMLWSKLESEYVARTQLAHDYNFHTLWSGAAGLSKKVFKFNNVAMVHDFIKVKGLSQELTDSELYKDIYTILNTELLFDEKLKSIVERGKNQNVNGVDFDLSVGGFHSKPKPGIYNSVYEYDFASLYPSLCVQNNIGGKSFTNILSNLLGQRLRYKKLGEKAKSDAYKLIINSITGCFRDPYAKDSVYSPKSSISMLLGGQFNMIDLIHRLGYGKVILSNTDSIWTQEKLPLSFLKDVYDRTGLVLEEEYYDLTIIKDVNSVCCVRDNKIVKRKKEFLEPVWTHNVKAPIIQRAVLNKILENKPIPDTIASGNNYDYSFFKRAKGDNYFLLNGEKLSDNKLRYYVSKSGSVLESITEKTKSRQPADSNITLAMNIDNIDKNNINFDWYIDKANKLLESIVDG